MCIRWSPVWWLRIRADRLQKRAASEQAVADQELLLEEMRKQFANRHLDVRLEHEDLAEAMRHNRTLATLARQKEYAAASDLFYREFVRGGPGARPESDGAPGGSAESSPMEAVLATVVAVAFLIFVYLVWQ